MGHHVEVLTPAEHEESLADEWLTFAGRTVPVPYNGSMASMQFGPVSAARVRRWLRDGHFDVVHVHEPAPPSVSLLVCMIAKGPIVATFHAATTRSKWLAAVGPGGRGPGWSGSAAGSRSPTSPAGCRSSTSAATR